MNEFDVCVIDEAAQALDVACMLALLKAKKTVRVRGSSGTLWEAGEGGRKLAWERGRRSGTPRARSVGNKMGGGEGGQNLAWERGRRSGTELRSDVV